eukprot:scaffold86771_cov48-Attheya_sp.AAC.2
MAVAMASIVIGLTIDDSRDQISRKINQSWVANFFGKANPIWRCYFFYISLTRAPNLSSLRKWPSEPSEWKCRNKSQSRLPTATPTVNTPNRHRYEVAS